MSKKHVFTGASMTLVEAAAMLNVAPDLLKIWVTCFSPGVEMQNDEPVLYPDDLVRYRALVQQMRDSGYIVVARSRIEHMETQFYEMRDSNLQTLRAVRRYLVDLQHIEP
jgi:hypothetical protein